MDHTILWTTRDAESLGMIPMFLSASDPRPAREQFNERYAHGGGWRKFEGFELSFDPRPLSSSLLYPGDPPLRELGRCTFRSETIIIFQFAWVCILQSALSVEAGGASQFYVSYRRKQPLVLTESYERALRTCLQIAKEKA